MKKEILKNISNDELKLHEDVNLSLNNNCNVVQDSNVSYGIEGLGVVRSLHRCGSIYDAYIQKYDKATIYNERMLIKKNNEIDEEIPLEWLNRLKTKEIKLFIPQGLITHITQAWESEEWKDHEWVKSRKSKSNLVRFIEVTAWLWTASKYNEGRIYYTSLHGIFNRNIDLIDEYQELLQMTWQSQNKKHIGQLALITKNPYGNRVEWNEFPFTQRCKLYTLTNKSLIKYLNLRKDEKIYDMGKDKILFIEYSNYSKLVIPEFDAIKGIEDDKLNDYRMKYNFWVSSPCYYTKSHDRVYAPSIMLPSVIRRSFTYNGHQLVWIDVASMHPVILLNDALEYSSEDEMHIILKIVNAENPRKELYNLLQTNISWDEFKVEHLKFLNCKIDQMRKMPFYEKYKELLPSFIKVLELAKETFGYKCISRYLLAKESTIMEDLKLKCYENSILAIGAHDGVDVQYDKVNEALELFNDVKKKYKLIMNVTIK